MFVFAAVVLLLCGVLLLGSGFWMRSKTGQNSQPSKLRTWLAVGMILAGIVMVGLVLSGTIVLPLK